jgi:hypothetical protein
MEQNGKTEGKEDTEKRRKQDGKVQKGKKEVENDGVFKGNECGY